MNILILGAGNVEQALINLCKKSKHLDHIYTASKKALDGVANVEYSDFADLVRKIKALQIDIVLNVDKGLIQDGIVEFLKKNMINVVSANQKWLNLENSRIAAKQLLKHYSINTSEIILAPKSFPIVLKTNHPFFSKIVNTMDELIHYRETISHYQVFLEEYLEGDVCYLLSLWDGKNVLYFNPNFTLTEVQEDRLDLYKTKLNIMFSDECPDFIGFFSSKLIWAKNDWHVLEYKMHLDKNFDMSTVEQDFLFILNSAIYQKLNEIDLK